jgi:hypothetical protein
MYKENNLKSSASNNDLSIVREKMINEYAELQKMRAKKE